MGKRYIDKQKYIENHLEEAKEFFGVAEKYLKYTKEQLKIIEKINKK